MLKNWHCAETTAYPYEFCFLVIQLIHHNHTILTELCISFDCGWDIFWINEVIGWYIDSLEIRSEKKNMALLT